jgi:hypothetical protein
MLLSEAEHHGTRKAIGNGLRIALPTVVHEGCLFLDYNTHFHRLRTLANLVLLAYTLWILMSQKDVGRAMLDGVGKYKQPMQSQNTSSSLYEVHVDRQVPVSMADGTILRADVYRPSTPDRYPVLIERVAYELAGRCRYAGEYYASRGYVVVGQNVRGRFVSEGKFVPFRDDGWSDHRDGYDTILWAGKQPWSNGAETLAIPIPTLDRYGPIVVSILTMCMMLFQASSTKNGADFVSMYDCQLCRFSISFF